MIATFFPCVSEEYVYTDCKYYISSHLVCFSIFCVKRVKVPVSKMILVTDEENTSFAYIHCLAVVCNEQKKQSPIHNQAP